MSTLPNPGVNLTGAPQPGAAPAPDHPANWWEFTKTLPHLDELPDAAYNGLREQFFQDRVGPWAMARGYAVGPTRDTFMQQTERPGKVAFPKLELAGKTALASFLAPMSVVGNQGSQAAQDWADKAEQEATRQGVNTTIPKIAGELAGTAPYWAAGLGAAGEAASAARLGEMGTRALKMGAMALIQGSYDAAKAPAGQRAGAGLSGAAAGAGVGALWEFTGPLARYLRGVSPELSSEEANAVEQVAKGTATEQQKLVASDAITKTPHLDEHVQDYVKQNQATAPKMGVPDSVGAGPSNKRVTINLQLANGKTTRLGGNLGAGLDQYAQIVDKIQAHLDAGGRLLGIDGDPQIANRFLKILDAVNKDKYTVPTPVGGAVAAPNVPTRPVDLSDVVLDAGQSTKAEVALKDGTTKTYTVMPGGDDYREVLNEIQGHLDEGGSIRSVNGEASVRAANAFMDTHDLASKAPDVWKYAEQRTKPSERALSGAPEVVTKGPLAVPKLDLPPGHAESELKSPEEMPEPGERPETPSLGFDVSEGEKVRGSADIPLNANGHLDTKQTGRFIAEKTPPGVTWHMYGGDLTRDLQTLSNVADQNAQTVIEDIGPQWRSMARGALEGGDAISGEKVTHSLVRDAPDEPHPGMSPWSTQPGESFNQFRTRFLGALKPVVDQWKAAPEDDKPYVGIFTHLSPARLAHAWAAAGMKDDLGVDVDTFLKGVDEPGEVLRFAPGDTGEWVLRKQNLVGEGDLRPGIYFFRHGETDWNGSEPTQVQADFATALAPGKPAPLVSDKEINVPPENYSENELWGRVKGVPHESSPESPGYTMYTRPGEKPVMGFQPEKFDQPGGPFDARNVMFHEQVHALANNLGMKNWFRDSSDDQMVQDIWNNVIMRHASDVYGSMPQNAAEEVYAYLSSAARTGQRQMLDVFAKGDTDKEHVLDWTAQMSRDLLDEVATKPASPYRNVAERKFQSVVNRATNQLEDIKRYYDDAGDLAIEDGQYVHTDPLGTRRYFTSRNEAADWLEKTASRPVNIPELVDTSILPDDTPRFASRLAPPSDRKPPIQTDPPPPDAIHLGPQVFSYFIRPFDGWIDTVARKIDDPAIYNAFYEIKNAQTELKNVLQPYVDTLKSTLGSVDRSRRTDFYNYLAATGDDARRQVLNDARITPDEFAKIEQFRQHFDDTGLFDYLKNEVPRLREVDYNLDARYPTGDKSFYASMMKSGQLDPRDTDLLSVAASYIRGRMFHDVMADKVDYAESLVKDSDQLGMLKPLLRRQLDYYRGKPDFTQRVVANSLNAAIDMVRQGIDKVNEKLPESLQIPQIRQDFTAHDALQNWILFSYAGGLAFRPAVLIRDALQLMITTYPLLGEEYTWKGMKLGFAAAKNGGVNDAMQIARNSGWLIERSQLPEMIAGGGEEGKGSVIENVQKMLNPIRLSHNANRIVAGFGHAAKVEDALADFAASGDRAAFVKDSDAWFMNPSMRDRWVKEAAALTERPDTWKEFSYRMARDLVELTQWDYTRGAMPGMYKYQLGRLFGQYGTWPMNYVEYARRFATQGILGDRSKAIQAMTRLVLAHGAVLKSGELMGVDTSKWVFTQPMAYGGGPLFQAVTQIPNTPDFETYKGTEARREIRSLFIPGAIPGGTEAEGMLKFLKDGDNENFWIRAFGFSPYDEKSEGWHRIVP